MASPEAKTRGRLPRDWPGPGLLGFGSNKVQLRSRCRFQLSTRRRPRLLRACLWSQVTIVQASFFPSN